MSAVALAAFVKTPKLSLAKTRLAVGIGEGAAAEFYRLAIAATEAVMKAAESQGLLSPYWAVAEAAGKDAWPSFPVVAQGEGQLGDRLHAVYQELWRPDRIVMLIGADAPAITVQHFALARDALLQGDDFVMGPATDGGFYLVGGKAEVHASVWNAVSYSQADTAKQLAARLAPAPIAWLPPLGDVDTAADLPLLGEALLALKDPMSEQIALSVWLKRLLA